MIFIEFEVVTLEWWSLLPVVELSVQTKAEERSKTFPFSRLRAFSPHSLWHPKGYCKSDPSYGTKSSAVVCIAAADNLHWNKSSNVHWKTIDEIPAFASQILPLTSQTRSENGRSVAQVCMAADDFDPDCARTQQANSNSKRKSSFSDSFSWIFRNFLTVLFFFLRNLVRDWTLKVNFRLF
jgi:hypothetical protein